MNEQVRQRGRPVGTGINDTATLAAIADMLAGDPGLKPTTAIHRLGINDPSIVRRLRDKLKSPLPPSAAAAPAATASTRPPQKSMPKSMPKSTPRTLLTAQAAAQSSTPPSKFKPRHPRPIPPTAEATLEAHRLAAEATTAVSRLYLHCVSSPGQSDLLSLALRCQILMGQWLAALLAHSQSE